ncbi:hypothetical protein BH11MYX3_BH11MYX3_19180 [soil metagenome]
MRFIQLAVLVVFSGCHFGASYSSQWGTLHAKSGVEIGGDNPDDYPDHTGSVRMNIITISDDTGWLRAVGMAAGSAAEESTRRDNEARSNGGYYHKHDIGVPDVVPGGRTRFAVAWGSSDTWTQKYASFTDSIEPRQIGDGPLFWSFEGNVLFGSIEHMDWKGNNDYLFRAQIGPLFGMRLGAAGPLDISGRVGFLIDPIFKPIAALAVEGGIPFLDLTTYVQVDAMAAGHVTLGARLAYDRGQALTPSSAATATITAGVVF